MDPQYSTTMALPCDQEQGLNPPPPPGIRTRRKNENMHA